MMLKKRANPWSRAKILLTVPVSAAAVAAFAIPVVENTADEMKAENDKLVASVIKEVNTVSPEPAAPVVEPAKGISPELVVAFEQKEDTLRVIKEIVPAKEEFVPDDNKVYEVAEVQPQYPGGLGALFKFIGENLKYPKASFEAGVQGKVIVQVVIRKDGSIGDVNVVRGIGTELDAEAVRVIGLMPKWKPGMINGKPVNVKYLLPVTFSLKK